MSEVLATFDSSVYRTNDDYFEKIAITLKRPNERTGFAVILTRRMEVQCFSYDEMGVFLATQDEWVYLDQCCHSMHDVTHQQVNKKLNEITTHLVHKHNVRDVPVNNHDCALMREEKKAPFNCYRTFDNLTSAYHMIAFEDTLQNSLGRHRARDALLFFRKHFPEMVETMVENLPTPSMKKAMPSNDQAYRQWGEWA